MVGEVKVKGYLIIPKTAKNLPVLIYNRGGNGNYGAMVFGNMMGTLFPIAENGFAIIGSQYRGTFERSPSHDDEFGGNDIHDVIALEKILQSIKEIDINKVGMLGGSRGAMQTLMASKSMPSLKAIALRSGNFDLEKDLEFRPKMESVYEKRIPNYLNKRLCSH
jgi:dipeptidyl aminopeptidase/acylaminoacyl peptidase